jgi:hypothetical protein
LPTPGEFQLSSTAQNPDPDGNFILNWTESLDASNHTLYKSNFPIETINSSVVAVTNGSINHTCNFENYSEGEYYFMVLAYNEYGNTSSNCVYFRVQFPPSDFTLNNLTEIPNRDGIINVTWSHSVGAKNYSMFMSESVIQDVDVNGILVAKNITDYYYSVADISNGDYYFAIVAYNEAGETMSNCINVEVRRAPTPFNLTSDAEVPLDIDGSFDLIWTHSEYAVNYTVFISDYEISVFNESVQELYNFTPTFE